MGKVSQAALWGDEHTELGEMAVAPLRPSAAVALSRGKFPKGYPHLDPNEDAVLAATDGVTWLLAVADGHNGFDAARAAVAALQTGAAAILKAAAGDPESAAPGGPHPGRRRRHRSAHRRRRGPFGQRHRPDRGHRHRETC